MSKKQMDPYVSGCFIIVFAPLLILALIFGINRNKETCTNETGTFTDQRDDRLYKWVRIGNQIWMAQNLAYKPDFGKFRIPGEDSVTLARHGFLYDWRTASEIAPKGWHLPSDDEWKQLEMNLGMTKEEADKTGDRNEDIGVKLKSIKDWNEYFYESKGTNESGFNAYPSGIKRLGYGFEKQGYKKAAFWTSTSLDIKKAMVRIVYVYGDICREGLLKELAISVRCLKDTLLR
jgi:uncharacterized protein (TIGR02145 family)